MVFTDKLMNRKLSLLTYLQSKHPSVSRRFLEIPVFDDNDYLYFLKNAVVVENSQQLRKGQIDMNSDFNDFIDSIINFLVTSNYQNVLVNGYHDSSSNPIWGSEVFSPSVNFMTNFMKSRICYKLCRYIGRDVFQDLFLNTSLYIGVEGNNYVQLCGVKPKGQVNPNTMLERFKKHKRAQVSKESRLLPPDSESLMKEIYPFVRKSLPKKLRKFKVLCAKVVANDKRCQYYSIYSNVCLEKRPLFISTNFDYATSSKKVITFVLTIVGKLFPLRTWGSFRNKHIVFDNVVSYVRMNLGEGYFDNDFSRSIKLLDIGWLGKTRRITSKQDHLKRSELLEKFLKWFFQNFINTLINNFWYVTESSHGMVKSTLCYPHSKWNHLSRVFLKKYMESYLIQLPSVLKDKCTSQGNFMSGHSKLLPKKSDFRLLCIPMKYIQDSANYGNKDFERYFYSIYLDNAIKPIRELVLHKEKEHALTNSRHPRCYSIIDVVKHITEFKDRLKHNGMKNTRLFILKFDIERCYDNIEHDKIFESIEKLFENDCDDKMYYVRQVYSTSMSNPKFGKNHYIIKQEDSMLEFELIFGEKHLKKKTAPKLFIDKVKTLKFTKSHVIQFVKSQVLDSVMLLPNSKLYKRRRGLYQGFPLLATLSDLVLSSIVNENFGFLQKDSCDSILLRLVDDFLVISTSKEVCQTVYDIAASELFRSYGVYANKNKTVLLDNSESGNDLISFVGLNINKKTLDIVKDSQTSQSSVSLNRYRNPAKAFTHLLNCYKNRLTFFFLDLRVCPFKLVLRNVELIMSPVLESFKGYLKYMGKRHYPFDLREQQHFIMCIIRVTIKKYVDINNRPNDSSYFVHSVRLYIASNLAKNPLLKPLKEWILKASISNYA